MDWTIFAVYFAACVAAASTGALFAPGEWYRSLRKPWFTPPDWAFPVAWTLMYTLSALAVTRVSGVEGNALAQALWALQIALNTLWSPVFFGLHRPKAGLPVVGALWLSVLGCCVTFWALDPVAGLMMVPYVLWVAVASALNIAIVVLNPNGPEATPAE